jgi:isoquinoline 1-oxidoreductase beta subunit
MSTQNKDFEFEPYIPHDLQLLLAERRKAMALSRRGFLKMTGLAGGGLVIGVSCSLPSEDAGPVSTTTFAANPFVQIRPDNTIVIFSKNPDVGQGVKTSMPMIVRGARR